MALTNAQKLARPIINFLVERYFPNSVFFYGTGALNTFDEMDSDRKAPIGSMAALSLARNAHRQNSDRLSVDAEGITINEEYIGDWRITVERFTPAGLAALKDTPSHV